MKLRFRGNSLRLRVNQREVQSLLANAELKEQIHFPGNASLSYTLAAGPANDVSLHSNTIAVAVANEHVTSWATTEDIGIYLNFPVDSGELRVAIEKDLECIDGPPDERDPEAFPRGSKAC